MLYLINTGISEQDSVLVQQLLSKFKSQQFEIVRLDTEPAMQDLEKIYLQFSNNTFFSQAKVLVINRIRLSYQLLDLLKHLVALKTDVVLVGKSADKRVLGGLLKKQKYTELRGQLNYNEVIAQLNAIFKNGNVAKILLPIIQVTDSTGKRFYSQSRLNLIKKWYDLLTKVGLAQADILNYILLNLDVTEDMWRMLNVMFRLSTKKDFLYFEGLLTHRDPYELLNLMRTQLATLYWVKTLQQKTKNCRAIAKSLGKNAFFVTKLCEINATPKQIIRILNRLFELEFKVRTGEVSDIKEGFMLILVST